ncbi:hypothetical protein D3C77_541700 [compost metagenome]
MQFTAFAFDDQGHGVGVVGQVLVEQQQVARPVEDHRVAAVQQQFAGRLQRLDARGDLLRVDAVRPLAHQPHQGGAVGAVAHAGGLEGPIPILNRSNTLIATGDNSGRDHSWRHDRHFTEAATSHTDLLVSKYAVAQDAGRIPCRGNSLAMSALRVASTCIARRS